MPAASRGAATAALLAKTGSAAVDLLAPPAVTVVVSVGTPAVAVGVEVVFSLPLVDEEGEEEEEPAAASVKSFWKRSSCSVFVSVRKVDRSEATPSGEDGDSDRLTAHGRDTA